MKRLGLRVCLLVATVLLAASLAVPAAADLSPNSVSLSLDAGECAEVTKSVDIAALPPTADVMFAFDLTGSMGGILDTAKARAGEIMTALNATGVDIQYGVISYMDYPAIYEFCGYSAEYGKDNEGYFDYAYRLDQSVTDNEPAVQTAINGLILGWGADMPESYARALYESWADTNISWRTGAKKILVNFGDSVPHDCDINQGISGSPLTTGIDPGRDGIAGTGDDIDFQDTALAGMISNNVILLACQTDGSFSDYWGPWAASTGGNVYNTSSGGMVGEVVVAVTEGLTSDKVYGLHLEVVDNGNTDGTWASFVPLSYPDLTPPTTVPFTETICVPSGTLAGSYHFIVAAVDDAGVYYGKQEVNIEVGGEPPHPSIPSMTQWGFFGLISVMTVAAMFMLRRRHTPSVD